MKHYRGSDVIKRNIIFILGIFFISMIVQPKQISATKATVIRVGYPPVKGFTEIKDGVYSGYAYEYLMEIAKYTGWEYEFIEMSVNDMLLKLRDGEIDIAGGMLLNEYSQELYDFPEENAGYTYRTLSVLKGNKSISRSNYETLNGIKVGYNKKSAKIRNSFLKFCEMNGIKDIELIGYTIEEDDALLRALKDKEVDAILGGDLLSLEDEKVIAKFGAMPYYFATTKGNTEVLSALNSALSKIKENNSSFERELYNSYFPDYNDPLIHLTQKEQDYINQMTPLKVAYIDNFAPLQNYNPKTKKAEGTYIDVMELIAQKTGLQYELVKASSYINAFEMIKNKEVDLLIGIPDSYSKAMEYEYALTQSYSEINMVRVYNAKKKSKVGKQIIALPRGYIFDELDGEYDVQYYETVEDCLVAVNRGKADLTYGNSNTLSNYITAGYYTNLSFVFDDTTMQVSIGISKPINVNLLNILNKSLCSISDSERKNISYTNMLNGEKNYTLQQFFFNNSSFCIFVIVFIVFLIGINIRMRYKRLVADKLALLKKSQMDVLTGVYNRATGTDLVNTSLQAKKAVHSCALMIIDIDHFKQVNDTLGHQRGDELLVEFSQLLKRVFSLEDIIFRLGGDEFIVFMTNLELSNFNIVEKRLQEITCLMNKEVSYKGQSQKISLSIGAIVSNKIHGFDELYQEADKMLYEVKRNGRNGFKIKHIF